MSELPDSTCANLLGLCADIDDTITTNGRLTSGAYDALERAHTSGLIVVAVTGRPAGWADHIARTWPLTGVVAENGALYMCHRDGGMVQKTIFSDDTRLQEHRAQLTALGEKIVKEVPGSALASDQPYRLFDLAIDFCEDVEALPQADVDRIVALFHDAGATCKVSSIHVNGWFGDYNKLGMLQRLLLEQCGHDLTHSNVQERFVYVGDSPNDQPMFEFFTNSVGVANVKDFAERLQTWPRYLTRSPAGAGFRELIEHILAHRA